MEANSPSESITDAFANMETQDFIADAIIPDETENVEVTMTDNMTADAVNPEIMEISNELAKDDFNEDAMIKKFMDMDDGTLNESQLLTGSTCPTPSSSILRSPSQALSTPVNSPTHADPTEAADEYISEFAKELAEHEMAEFEDAADLKVREEEEDDWITPSKKSRKEEKRMKTLSPWPESFHHNDLIKRHPSGMHVRLFEQSWKKYITSTTSDIFFRPITWNGYSNKKFVDTLYPRHGKRPRKNPTLNAYDYMSFEAAVDFRRFTRALTLELDNGYFPGRYTSNYPPFDLPIGERKTVIAPITKSVGSAVLYQVVRRDENAKMLILEAKDFFVFLDGREDLRLLRLTMHASDVCNKMTGFDPRQVSVSDLVWIHSVEVAPSSHAIMKRMKIIENMKKTENCLIYYKTPSILYNVTHFAFVTPMTKIRKTLGIVTNYPGEKNGYAKKVDIVMENNTASCSLQLDAVPFSPESMPRESLIWADARHPTTHSCRFSAQPATVEDSVILHQKVATIWPIRMEESPTPTGVHMIEPTDLARIRDRIEGFSSYAEDPQKALTQLAHVYNVSCARLADAANNADDRSWHHITMSMICSSVNLISFYGIIDNRLHEQGYVRGRQVVTLIEGFTKAFVMNLEKSELIMEGEHRQLGVYLTTTSRSAKEFFTELRQIEKHMEKTILVSFRLSDNSEQADPLSAHMIKITDIPLDLSTNGGQAIHQAFSNILPSDKVDDVMNIDEKDLKYEHAVPDEVSLEGEGRLRKVVKLGKQQKKAIQAGLDLRKPIVNIQSCYGSGKTLTLAVLNARAIIRMLTNRVVVIVAVTNSGVAQAINTVLQMADYRQDIIPLRFVGDAAAADHPTDADVSKILEKLEETSGLEMSLRELANLREFLDRRKQMLQLKNDTSLVDIPINDQESFKIAETRCSQIVHGIIKTMMRVRQPNVIGVTISTLLNITEKGEALHAFFRDNSKRLMIINDESSQTPEPALAALALRFPDATYRFFGDRHQLQPYCRVIKTAFAAQCGARGLATILSEGGDIPKVTLAETFRSHPELNDLPNKLFYNGHLISGVPKEDRMTIVRGLNLNHPLLFVDIRGETSTAVGGHSLKNEKEANFAVRLAQKLIRIGIPAKDIAIICMYNEQKKHIQSLKTPVNVTTVDSIQGKEFEAVILATTKAVKSYNPFLDEHTRTNVAITRARSGLFILGSKYALSGIPLWKDIVNHTISISAFMTEREATNKLKL